MLFIRNNSKTNHFKDRKKVRSIGIIHQQEQFQFLFHIPKSIDKKAIVSYYREKLNIFYHVLIANLQVRKHNKTFFFLSLIPPNSRCKSKYECQIF